MGVTPFFDKLSFGTLFGVLMLMPIVSHAGGLGMAPLVFTLGILGLILAFKTERFKITQFQSAMGIFLIWLCISAAWSPYKPDDLLTNYFKLFIMGIIYYWSWPLFEQAGRRDLKRLQYLLMVTCFLGAGLLVIDLLSRFRMTFIFNANEADAIMNLGHGITILVLLAAPVMVLMRANLPKLIARLMIVLFLILIFWAAWLNNLSVGVLGLIGVVVAVVVGHFFPRRTPAILLGISIVMIMSAPLFAYAALNYSAYAPENFPMSWDHRLRMWGYCWHVIAEHPLRGAGFDASRTFSETYIASDGRELTTVSLHPHNAPIQIWTEAGVIGAILASSVVMSLFKPVEKFIRCRGHAGAVSGVIMATFIISSLTYGAWQFWWWACVFFAVGILYLLPNSKDAIAFDDPQ